MIILQEWWSKMAKKYSESFKANAVRKVRDGGLYTQVAKEVGVSVYSLRQWVNRADEGEGERPLTREEQAEIKKLRAQVRELTEERDILKKATAYFAKGQT
jgi:transposase-like protein